MVNNFNIDMAMLNNKFNIEKNLCYFKEQFEVFSSLNLDILVALFITTIVTIVGTILYMNTTREDMKVNNLLYTKLGRNNPRSRREAERLAMKLKGQIDVNMGLS